MIIRSLLLREFDHTTNGDPWAVSESDRYYICRYVRQDDTGDTPIRSFAGAAQWFIRALAAEIAAQRSIRQLASMSDYGLHDLGLESGDLERVVRQGRL